MRAVVQRCVEAAVRVDGVERARIGRGFVAFLGVGRTDDEAIARTMAERIVRLRAFEDARGRMNLALTEVGGALLLVPQFTVVGDLRRGHRPSFHEAALPETAERLWRFVGDMIGARGAPVALGVFGAHMEVSVRNDGPAALLLDSAKVF